MTAPEGGKTKQELSKAILHTANHLFMEHGIDTVSMHQIAKSAGIGQGTLYRRYSNKGDLCMDILKENFEQFIQEIDLYLVSSTEHSVQDRLRAVMRQIISFVDKKFKWLGVVHSYIKVEENHQSDFFNSPPYLYLHRTISELLVEGSNKGIVRAVDPIYTAHSFISILAPHTYQHLNQVMGYSLETIQDQFCATFIDPLFQ